MKNALSQDHSVQVLRKESKSYTMLRAITDILEEDQQPEGAIPVFLPDGKKGECKQLTFKGSCSRGATCAFKHDDRKRGKQDSKHRVRQTVGGLFQNPNSATRQEQSPQDETIDLHVTVTKKKCDY